MVGQQRAGGDTPRRLKEHAVLDQRWLPIHLPRDRFTVGVDTARKHRLQAAAPQLKEHPLVLIRGRVVSGDRTRELAIRARRVPRDKVFPVATWLPRPPKNGPCLREPLGGKSDGERVIQININQSSRRRTKHDADVGPDAVAGEVPWKLVQRQPQLREVGQHRRL